MKARIRTSHGLVRAALVAAAVISGSGRLQAQVFDDFSDLQDTSNPAWTHLSGYVNSTGQTWSAATGQYRMTAPNNGAQALGFVGSYAGPSFSDVDVRGDVVSFTGPPAGAVFGVAARLNGLNAVAQLTGYAYAYEPFAAGGTGEMVLYRINPGVSLTDIGGQQVTLDPSKDYTFVLSVQGTQLHGQVFEIGGGMVAEKFGSYAFYASGFSGFIAYSQNPVPPVDVTWDNFSAQVPGDYNNNGIVDAADYVAWRNGTGTTFTQDDYNVWRANFGRTPGSGSGASVNVAVPEPATAVLLLMAAVGIRLRGRRIA